MPWSDRGKGSTCLWSSVQRPGEPGAPTDWLGPRCLRGECQAWQRCGLQGSRGFGSGPAVSSGPLLAACRPGTRALLALWGRGGGLGVSCTCLGPRGGPQLLPAGRPQPPPPWTCPRPRPPQLGRLCQTRRSAGPARVSGVSVCLCPTLAAGSVLQEGAGWCAWAVGRCGGLSPELGRGPRAAGALSCCAWPRALVGRLRRRSASGTPGAPPASHLPECE